MAFAQKYNGIHSINLNVDCMVIFRCKGFFASVCKKNGDVSRNSCSRILATIYTAITWCTECLCIVGLLAVKLCKFCSTFQFWARYKVSRNRHPYHFQWDVAVWMLLHEHIALRYNAITETKLISFHESEIPCTNFSDIRNHNNNLHTKITKIYFVREKWRSNFGAEFCQRKNFFAGNVFTLQEIPSA